jgi:hypothetical protein
VTTETGTAQIAKMKHTPKRYSNNRSSFDKGPIISL